MHHVDTIHIGLVVLTFGACATSGAQVVDASNGCDEYAAGRVEHVQLTPEAQEFVAASAKLDAATLRVSRDVYDACSGIAADLGKADTWSKQPDLTSQITSQDGTGACDVAVTAIRERIARAKKPGVSLQPVLPAHVDSLVGLCSRASLERGETACAASEPALLVAGAPRDPDTTELVAVLEARFAAFYETAAGEGFLIKQASERVADAGNALSEHAGDLDGKSLACVTKASSSLSESVGALEASLQASAKVRGSIELEARGSAREQSID